MDAKGNESAPPHPFDGEDDLFSNSSDRKSAKEVSKLSSMIYLQ